MASFRQHGNGWQGRIRRRGYPDITKTFRSKVDAEKWARSLESEIDKGLFVNVTEAQRTTLSDLIARYLADVTPTMKGAAEDTIRLKAIMRKPIARWSMANLSAARIAAYRDERLNEVSAGTVIRELAYISAIFNHARREWEINVPNPVQMVRKPQSPQARPEHDYHRCKAFGKARRQIGQLCGWAVNANIHSAACSSVDVCPSPAQQSVFADSCI